MMDQLGIKALRPGPSGNEKAPNHANYDEAKANPYPDLPDPLTMNDGQKVTSAQMWWDKRRPEIVERINRSVVVDEFVRRRRRQIVGFASHLDDDGPRTQHDDRSRRRSPRRSTARRSSNCGARLPTRNRNSTINR